MDIVSRDYSFKFDKDLYQEWNWKELYAPQAELMDYVQHLVKRYKLEDRVQYRSVVSAAKWNEDAGNWSVTVQHEKEDGTKENQTWTAKYLVLATGCLTVPNLPDFPGVAEFKGEKYHTSRWPREKIDYAGKKVAVIGTGSSGIQTIPVVAEQAAHLHVFQRTANYSLPARNRKLTPEELAAAKEDSERLRKIGWSNSVGHGTFPMDDMKSWDESTPEEREARIKKVFDLGGRTVIFAGLSSTFDTTTPRFFHRARPPFPPPPRFYRIVSVRRLHGPVH